MSYISQSNVLDYAPLVSTQEVTTPLPAMINPTFSQPNLPIIAICQLKWDGMWQRPQQLLSRLAKHHAVLFIETHCTQTRVSFTRTRSAKSHPSVTILELHLPAERWHDGDFIDAERRHVIQDRLAVEFDGAYDDAILWFNDPLAVKAYAGQLGESMIVYDCMDEHTQAQGASATLQKREQELTCRADLIFCSGRKMRDKRLPYNGNTHFYGAGVDCQHFGQVLTAELEVDREIAALSGPVLGYFGVVDERIDYPLLAALADAHADWSIAMIGPVTKVDPATLPRRKNLHWMGSRSYDRLPAITKGFSVCLMPFSLNAATEFLNPSIALEYMAAGRPVVSTALDEVNTNFSSCARVASTHAEFITMCRREVDSPDRSRIRRGLKLAAENTWEAIIAKMEVHIKDVLTPSRVPQGKRSEERQSNIYFESEARTVYV